LFTDMTITRNSAMIEAAVDLYRTGKTPPAYLIDLDSVNANCRHLAETAKAHGMNCIAMTKSTGHNPHVAQLALDRGMSSLVAVEARQAFKFAEHGHKLGHVGHLSQIPRRDIHAILGMRPDFVTVYSLEIAKAISDWCETLGRRQPVLVTISHPGDDGLYEYMVGGWTIRDCVEGIRPLLDLPGIELVGVTTHVAVGNDQDDAATVKPTEAFFTTLRGKEKLERAFGIELPRINAAGNANCLTIPRWAQYGVTDVEPGAAIIGNSRFHAMREMPEIPAQVFVTERTHTWDGREHVIGGAFGNLPPNEGVAPAEGLFGHTLDEALKNRRRYVGCGQVDFHGAFAKGQQEPEYGMPVVFPHIANAYLDRAPVVTVSGIQDGKPVVRGIFDSEGTIDRRFPQAPGAAVSNNARVSRIYAPTRRS
jgi:predicted amino acid racemase